MPKANPTRPRLAGLAIFAVLVASANTNALARTGHASAYDNGVFPNPSAAHAAAQTHLDHVLALIPEGDTAVSSTVVLRIRNSDGTLVWLTDPRRIPGAFYGRREGQGSGASQHFTRAEVVDWSFTAPDGRLFGNFAARQHLETLPPEQAASIARTLTENPTPEEWVK